MTLRPRDRIALAVVLLLAAVAGFYMLVLKPQQKKAASLATQISAQQQALTQAQSAYAAGRAAQASLKAGSKQWAALTRALPQKPDIPALLRTLESNAHAVGVKMTAIQLTSSSTAAGATATPPATTTGATTTGTTGSTDATAVASAPTSVPLQLTFSGGYRELNNLVRRLNGLVVVSGKSVQSTGPLLTISNISLSGSGNLTVQLTASIYELSAPTTTTSAPTGGTS
jgi:cytoskeletal protein RodZ